MTVCRVYGCQNEAVNVYCGKHEEDAEEGVKLRLKVGRPKGSGKPPLFPQEDRRPRCAARTNKGTERCMNAAATGSDLCGIHRTLALHLEKAHA